tara:strand:+ start:3167 stop:4396 length:1230 start_codon:yes stop_codon:yes gene_type:complete
MAIRKSRLINQMKYIYKFLFFCVFLFSQSLFPQSKQDLEMQKQELTTEIKKIEKLINQSKNRKRDLLINAENLKFKINLQNDLISNINSQLNIIVNEIERNSKELSKLYDRQKKIKNEYAAMILKTYKHRSMLNKIMFIFSSKDFVQAYKRLQYYKQYARYKDKQIEEIRRNTILIDSTIDGLGKQKTAKQLLIDENQHIKDNLSIENLKQEKILFEIRTDEKRYVNQIKQKQKQTIEIDKQIQKIIDEAIAKTKNKNLPEFKLSEEAKLISKKFAENKGKLPWPVDKGLVILKYGKQPHPIVKTTTIQSNGVRILTSDNQEVRSIFDGKVYSIIVSKNGSHAVLIQHGNFFSVYKNLSEIYIKKGDLIITKQALGKLSKNKSTGQTILNFSIFKDGSTENPSSWIYKL